ncbi:glycerol-3-phosphate 1-O-acyltransferase PlsB [Amnimonas aquatica]|uniref:Glycerol-3-phosphate acyltransferase n=1 Tax=Amnimonas aquatica TaxID=2094561 RepID=A0A2P6AU81_9GAMM|nr:glycerol-3-phosphate 1-O-acyltransferase PlsB [Amnimonas aquatica]PQA48948.1 glycerol-3-phosphate 1-O-acyltransferase [Amnimonas aquatica]
MLSLFGLDRLFRLIIRKLMYLWVRVQVLPHDLKLLGIDPDKPICYVLQNRLLSNVLVLDTETRRLGLPRPMRSMRQHGLRERYSLLFLTREQRNPLARPPHAHSPRLVSLVDAVHADPTLDVQLVPVTILWGRSPEKESSWLKVLFADSWATPTALKQLITILLHGRQTMLKINPPLSLRQLSSETESSERTLRKVSRVLRVHFRRQRSAAIGPDMSHRRTLLDEIMRSEPVEAAIAREVMERGVSREVAESRARLYGNEIASDYSYPVIRFLEIFLTWLWTRLYNGVTVHNMEVIEKHATDHEIIYVPCHRSHIDYLLLSYVIFTRGYMTPHIAAGANLNMPVVGGLLRRGGAFFLRRTFKDNFLYGAVFNEYLHQMLSRGFPIEYFVEGGRSRTGRLLSSKLGMINMTLRSYLRDHNRPLVFIPAYIGYEKLMEGGTYIGELQGKPKEKENLFSLAMSVRKLQKVFGKVHLSFGEPIYLNDVLDAGMPGWRGDAGAAERPEFTATSLALGSRISTGINASAVVNPINLLSLVLLSTPKHAIDEDQLAEQLELNKALLAAVPYSALVQVTDLDGHAMIAYGEELKILQRRKHPLGDLLYLHEEEGVLMTYFRNNTLHLFVLPSLLAVLLLQRGSATREQALHMVRSVYPFLKSELFLIWSDDQLPDVVDAYLEAMAGLGLLGIDGERYVRPGSSSEAYARLHILSRALRQTLVRYHMTITVLNQRGSGRLTQQQLEELCHLLAQRLSFVREFSAPEFFDKTLFRGFLDTLKGLGFLCTTDDGHLVFDERLSALADEALEVLPSGIRQAIQQVTLITDEEVAAALLAMEQAAAKRKGKGG